MQRATSRSVMMMGSILSISFASPTACPFVSTYKSRCRSLKPLSGPSTPFVISILISITLTTSSGTNLISIVFNCFDDGVHERLPTRRRTSSASLSLTTQNDAPRASYRSEITPAGNSMSAGMPSANSNHARLCLRILASSDMLPVPQGSFHKPFHVGVAFARNSLLQGIGSFL
jgi:hypothetical protein